MTIPYWIPQLLKSCDKLKPEHLLRRSRWSKQNRKPHTGARSPQALHLQLRFFSHSAGFFFLLAERSGMGGKGQVITALAQSNHELIIGWLSQLLSVRHLAEGTQTAITRSVISLKFSLEESGYLGWGRSVKRKKAHLMIPVKSTKPVFLRYYQPHASCSLQHCSASSPFPAPAMAHAVTQVHLCHVSATHGLPLHLHSPQTMKKRQQSHCTASLQRAEHSKSQPSPCIQTMYTDYNSVLCISAQHCFILVIRHYY